LDRGADRSAYSSTKARSIPEFGETDHRRQAATAWELAASGVLRIAIQGVYSIDRAGEAFQAFQQGTRGKLIVRV